MDFKVLKWQILRGTLMRRLILKAILFAMAMLMFSYIEMAHHVRTLEPMMWNVDGCGSNPQYNSTGLIEPLSEFARRVFGLSRVSCVENEDLLGQVFKELIKKGYLVSKSKTLCVGDGSSDAVMALEELGVPGAIGVDRHPFFSLLRRGFVYELDFGDNYFDFVLSRSLDRVSVPALLVLEIERVLRPGGAGAMLVGAEKFYSGGLVRSATPVSSFLKSSDVVHVCSISSFTLVIFKKRSENVVASLEHLSLPKECPSIDNNKKFMKHIEPLGDDKSAQVAKKLSYLPYFMDISSRNRLVYINIGAGELAEASVAKMFKPYYTNARQALSVFVVDHNTSIISSYVKNPGISFIYHPGLAGGQSAPDFDDTDEFFGAPLEDEKQFDFISWFDETIKEGDFVAVLMNAGAEELNFLGELFKTGDICRLDELFLHWSDPKDCKAATSKDCISLLNDMRNRGVYAHQWLED